MKVVQCLGYLSKILLNIQCCHFFSSWRVQMRFERALIYALRCYNKRPPNYIQPRIACSRPCCRRFNARKSGARDGLVSSLNSAFSTQRAIQLLFALENLPWFFERSAKARRKRAWNHMWTAVISAGTHKFKSAVSVSVVPFLKSTLNKLEHILPCKSSGPCPNLLARVPKFWSAVPKMSVV